MSSSDTKEPFSATRLLVELCPVPLFLIAYLLAAGPEARKIVFATAVFIAAKVFATLAKLILKRPIRALSWASTILVVVMGGLTIWLRDATFIKISTTLYAVASAAMVGSALLTGRPWMQTHFDNDRHLAAVDEAGRRKLAYVALSMSIAMAVLNELIWRNTSTLTWIGFQIWGWLLVFLVFAMAVAPIMSRHWSGQCKVGTAE